MFTILKDINFNKTLSLHKHPDFQKQYNDFMINKFLSMGAETTFEANFMNVYHRLPKHIKYLFLSHAIEKKDRFLKFLKSDKDKDNEEMCKYIMKIHHVNKAVAEMMLKTISDEEKGQYKQIFNQKTIRKR